MSREKGGAAFRPAVLTAPEGSPEKGRLKVTQPEPERGAAETEREAAGVGTRQAGTRKAILMRTEWVRAGERGGGPKMAEGDTFLGA